MKGIEFVLYLNILFRGIPFLLNFIRFQSDKNSVQRNKQKPIQLGGKLETRAGKEVQIARTTQVVSCDCGRNYLMLFNVSAFFFYYLMKKYIPNQIRHIWSIIE